MCCITALHDAVLYGWNDGNSSHILLEADPCPFSAASKHDKSPFYYTQIHCLHSNNLESHKLVVKDKVVILWQTCCTTCPFSYAIPLQYINNTYLQESHITSMKIKHVLLNKKQHKDDLLVSCYHKEDTAASGLGAEGRPRPWGLSSSGQCLPASCLLPVPVVGQREASVK